MDEGRVTTDSQLEEGVVIRFLFPSVSIVSENCQLALWSSNLFSLQREHVEERVTQCVFWDFGSGSDRYKTSTTLYSMVNTNNLIFPCDMVPSITHRACLVIGVIPVITINLITPLSH